MEQKLQLHKQWYAFNGMDLLLEQRVEADGSTLKIHCLDVKPLQNASYDDLIGWQAICEDGQVFQDARTYWEDKNKRSALAILIGEVGLEKVMSFFSSGFPTPQLPNPCDVRYEHSPMEGTL